ncbi:hypothetical protein BBO99_00006778 [Phytophthora kernoviae]|uniref:Uncharacterized protein n=2 Tax=Phytophthora kernoviae TaxID=325452 RepID=A0A3R7IL48_9STRA|nr:hypothetical protein G195_008274 [Phytophthora kernoviae 00238/432]KAG2515390.1 hypothetical protein JM18_006120 [Phytophthora kernoviae]KAG2519431.1 hypothetical protein JM16_006329 [Phytophthora kernoviae]RLN31545.1 hypothetical protein BBI17_006778 [Phytophthora kernoviae]RLN77393.1 hypothetical protein BBO99_00006778 [Phytophthora kernoviae]
MMAWPEEPQSRAGDWPESELLESAAFYTPDPDERAQHGANNFAGQNQSGLTYSASCPSFSGMDDADNLMAETGAGNGLLPYPFGAQEPLVDVIGPGDPLFSGDKNYDMLLEFQQEYQNSSQRQFPHQQAMGQPMDLVQQQMAGGRRGFHGSQSFTSLASMETDYNRMNASKRKKGTERWMKLQRHKSFDSTTPLTEPFGLGDATFGGNFNSVNASTGAEMLQNSSDRDIIGFSIDDFSSTMPSDDPNWPPMSYGSAPSAIGGSYMQEAHQPHLQQMSMQTSDSDVDKSVSSSAEVEPASELDMLLSENERANLFDAIRDFESPSDTGMLFDTQPSPEQPPQQLPLETKERSAPNPLPTASNPMGLIGGLPPHFGYSLSLYLEQTSAPFRAEVKSRVEKRVTAAAGQDLLQHMQKKTRLRSLDDLRSEARTIVLGEMERELHFHMQAYNWANSTAGASPDGAAQLPPYLLNFSTAGFGAFQAQQAALQAAMTSSSRPPSAPSTSPQGAPKRTRSASNSSKLASSGSSSKVSVREK